VCGARHRAAEQPESRASILDLLWRIVLEAKRHDEVLQDLSPSMDNWDLKRLALRPHHPQILSSSEEGRAIVLDLPEGEMLQEHQIHEGAWITVIDGEVRITSPTGQTIDALPGALVQFAPRERHEVKALADSRILLLLTPWPGCGHPGAMTVEQKSGVRERAAERAS
jgi:quercetin dioxygenase-like cupin family protein